MLYTVNLHLETNTKAKKSRSLYVLLKDIINLQSGQLDK